MSWRERWYAANNLPYEPPKLGDCPPFRCTGIETETLYRRITSGQLGPRQQRLREPGDDDAEIAA